MAFEHLADRLDGGEISDQHDVAQTVAAGGKNREHHDGFRHHVGNSERQVGAGCQPETQVEVSLTDARTLGVNAPVKMSGDIAGSGSITLKGPAGEVTIEEGVIAAQRHIHMTPEDAEAMGLKDGQMVSVKVDTERGVVFNETVLRVSPKFATAMHIDTDEANAVMLPREAYGIILD